jgi:antitoxin ParD1/3/4
MPTRNINLTKRNSTFITRSVSNGEFQNASEVVRAGLRLLEQSQREDNAKLELLRRAVKVGILELENDKKVLVRDSELSRLIRDLGKTASKKIVSKAKVVQAA